MKITSLLLLILVSTANAQTQKKVVRPLPKANTTVTTTAVASTISPTTPPIAPAAPAPQPWKLTYFGEYVGPRLSNFDLSKTQDPTLGSKPTYTAWSHAAKIGYAVSSEVVLGTQIRAASKFDPNATSAFAWKNHRLYFAWKNMIDTSDINMTGVLDWELPTSTGAKNAGLVMAFNIKNNWTIKTSLRNWSFSALTLVRPSFYNLPTGKSDLYFGIFPSISCDLASDWTFMVEGSFDASHTYDDTYFSFGEDDPDNFNVGLQYSFNAHFQINPALRFFTANYSVPVVYLGVSAAL